MSRLPDFNIETMGKMSESSDRDKIVDVSKYQNRDLEPTLCLPESRQAVIIMTHCIHCVLLLYNIFIYKYYTNLWRFFLQLEFRIKNVNNLLKDKVMYKIDTGTRSTWQRIFSIYLYTFITNLLLITLVEKTFRTYLKFLYSRPYLKLLAIPPIIVTTAKNNTGFISKISRYVFFCPFFISGLCKCPFLFSCNELDGVVRFERKSKICHERVCNRAGRFQKTFLPHTLR